MSAMYNFLFDRKSLTLLICGFVVGGGLLFFSGVLVGVYWSLPYGTEIQARALSPLPRPAPRPAPETVPSAAPPPTVVPEPAAAPVPPVQERRIELPTAPPAPAVSPAPPGPVAEESEAIGLRRTVPAAPVPAPAPLAASIPVPAPAPPVSLGEARYSVQVGAYSQLENSQATVAQLARRGYEPYVVEVRSARGGVLHMVRLGRYPDRGAAARAASDFRRKERMEAIVAPLPRGEQSATSG